MPPTLIQPPALKKGARIGITCPAGYMPRAIADACVHTLQTWGYEVWVGHTVGSDSPTYFSGTDAVRLAEMQAMLDTPELDAILCGRGGYGSSRIIDQLNFRAFKKNPKWLIGFSDITVFHAHLSKVVGVASLHASMASAFRNAEAAIDIQTLQHALQGKRTRYVLPAHEANHIGQATGPLVGGNLAILAHLIGTKSFPRMDGAILFLEDVGEQLYNLDRMLVQLHRAGVFQKISGLILGGFTDCQDTTRPFGENVAQLLQRQVTGFTIPIAFDFPVSHGTPNYCLKHGVIHHLHIKKDKTVILREV
jgi:muramoyltetrapeptide carboxypeptidase